MIKSEIKLRVFIFILYGAAFLTAIVGGYFYYQALKNEAASLAHYDAENDLKELGSHFVSDTSWILNTARTLARLTELEQFLTSGDGAGLSAVNDKLDDYNRTLQADVCYLIDRAGNTLASSNRNAADSFVGHNFGFRPYFKQSIKGVPMVYMALGSLSKSRGIYFSHPVYEPDGKKPIGVAVIKASVQKTFEHFKQDLEGVLLLIDPLGVVFASNHAEYLFHFLWEMSPKEIAQIDTQQFGPGPFTWMGVKRFGQNHAIDKRGRVYRLHRYNLINPVRWQLIYLHDERIVTEKYIAPITKSVGTMVLISLAVFGSIILFLYLKIEKEFVQRTKAEQALRISEERLKVIFETVPDPIALYDIQGDPKYLLMKPKVFRH